MCNNKDIKTLRINVSHRQGCVTRLEKVAKEMENFGVETLDEVRESLVEAQASAKFWNDTLKSAIKKCDHDWKRNGHTSHEDCYECTKCGETKFE